MPSPSPPPNPETLPNPETSDPFICAICYKDIDPNRPPNLNLDYCSCGEVGTSINDPEADIPRPDPMREEMHASARYSTIDDIDQLDSLERSFLDKLRDPKRKAMIMQAIHTSISNDACDEEDLDSKEHTYQPNPNNDNTSKLSFAMTAYLATLTPQSHSDHLSQPLPAGCPCISTSETGATIATSSLRSSQSIASWSSGSRILSKEVLCRGIGEWMQPGDGDEPYSVEMSWSWEGVGMA